MDDLKITFSIIMVKLFYEYHIEYHDFKNYLLFNEKYLKEKKDITTKNYSKQFSDDYNINNFISLDDVVRINNIYPQRLRWSYIIFSSSLLENFLIKLSNGLKYIYNLQTTYENITKRGGIFDKTKNYIKLATNINISEIKEWKDIKNLYSIRNVIIHHLGFLSDKTKKAKNIVLKFPEFLSNENSYLIISYEYIMFIIETIDNFIKEIRRKIFLKEDLKNPILIDKFNL